jgi:fumarate reductase subunit D
MSTVQSGNSAVKRAAANPVLELLERLGYTVRGALYAVMGLLALRIVFSVAGGQATDLTGSLVSLIQNPYGKLVLVIAAVGLAAYSIWGFTRAI